MQFLDCYEKIVIILFNFIERLWTLLYKCVYSYNNLIFEFIRGYYLAYLDYNKRQNRFLSRLGSKKRLWKSRENHGKTREITENHGKSRKITGKIKRKNCEKCLVNYWKIASSLTVMIKMRKTIKLLVSSKKKIRQGKKSTK